MQIHRLHSRQIAWLGQKIPGALPPGQKISHRLHRCPIVTAPQPEGKPLPLPLELNAPQHMAGKIRRIHRHQQGGICHPGIAAIIAHAISHHAPGLRGRGHHLAPRAHAEGIGSPAGCPVIVGQGIISHRQKMAACILPVLGHINKLLRMLYPDPDGKGLCFHGYTSIKKHLISIPGGMADAQEDSPC